ncbi:MAG: metalloregulator ArsR/SmtB family transcription factor [Alphaproteobacteria bacterium]|nr:metalloregulator ArsR/SmtB family transcription factor [Alphaproteobacteria bacterium]
MRDPYIAIADPTRREILDLLLQRSVLPAGEIALQFREVSRPAISRHLRILKECGVVKAFQRGKTQNYSLIPEPINEIREGWLARFGDLQTESLINLRKLVEESTKSL